MRDFPGGLFHPSDDKQEVAFRYATENINANREILPKSRLSAQVEVIQPQDSFHASKRGESHNRIGNTRLTRETPSRRELARSFQIFPGARSFIFFRHHRAQRLCSLRVSFEQTEFSVRHFNRDLMTFCKGIAFLLKSTPIFLAHGVIYYSEAKNTMQKCYTSRVKIISSNDE